jgi:signal transduction histidine kinase/ActR/RegA family two-component response regulator/predicted negative regulator of RcsB-dependent stress response
MQLVAKSNSIRSREPSPVTLGERVELCCMIAREKLEIGDYDAGCAALQPWWTLGEWPRRAGLSNRAAAELFLTAGILSGWVASTRPIDGDQKQAAGLLNGAIALFEQLDETTRAVEGRIELALCYYREGLFDLARNTLRSSLQALSEDGHDLKAVSLIRLASVERHAGRLHDALALLDEAAPLVSTSASWTNGRFHSELATTLNHLGIAENRQAYFDRALGHYNEALLQFEKIGNLRYAAAIENNHGYLLLSLKRFEEAQIHLHRARKLFDGFGDTVGCAQVDETLSQLYIASEQYESAERSIKLAVDTLDKGGEDALLAEALNTQGLILCRLGRRYEAKPTLERARRVAERCGNYEGAGKSLLILIEEMCEQLGDDERREIGAQANQLLANSQQPSTRERLRNCLERITAAHAEHEQQREKATHAEKMAALGELSFGVAHNVNNTLTGILGRAQLLTRTTDPEKTAAGLALIIKSAEDGAHIIKRIQDFARERPSREFQSISVAELLTEVCEMTRPRWETRPPGGTIRCALHADCTAVVMGDPVELREVIVNMIYNAVDAMPQGGEIRLGAHETSDRVILTITDTGTGMPPEVKSRLFNPFFTTKGKAGTGMGLAVSFGIVRRHDGSIEVDSQVERGTTFRISLPLATGAPAKCSHAGSQTSDGAQTQGRIRLLVVDDETTVRDVLTEALRAEGCEVVTADNGQVALKLFDDYGGEFDAVFTDIGMPEMNGWELATAIRRRSETIALAIVSGWADAISANTRNIVKADWVVSKPFDINRIAEIANEIAERKKLLTFPSQIIDTVDRRQRSSRVS